MSKFQDQVSKPRTSRAHKSLLDGGRKDLTKHGQPFSQARPVDKSNAFVAKEEYSADPEEELEEVSAVSAGSVEGHAGSFVGFTDKDNKKHKKDTKKKEVVEMQSRQEMANELRARKTISKMLDLQKKKVIKESIARMTEHFRLRRVLSHLISESDVEKNPHSNTGINKLEILLKKIVPTLEDSYKSLTSNKDQRSSFRAHILNAIENALKPEDAKEKAEELGEQPVDLEEVEINIKDSDPLNASDEDKFIDIADSEGGENKEEDEEDPLDSFGIEGEDNTGRNEAFEAFKQIENQIVDTYGVLQDPNDREVFYDYLLTNIKMYFDKFEEELASVAVEPSSDSYEAPEEPDEAPLDQEQI